MLAVYLPSAQAGFVAGLHVGGDGGMAVKCRTCALTPTHGCVAGIPRHGVYNLFV